MDNSGTNHMWTLNSQNKVEVFMYECNIIIWTWVDFSFSTNQRMHIPEWNDLLSCYCDKKELKIINKYFMLTLKITR